MADNETIEDIIAEMETERPGLMNGPINTNNLYYSRRLKAALERERGDAAKLREAIITIRDKAHEQYVNDNGIDTVWIQDIANAALAAPARNCVVGRDTLSAALEQVNKVYDILSRPCVCLEEARQGCREARGVLIPALAAPPRNCDVGTVTDQMERFEKWFPTSPYCDGQVHKILVAYANWVQMPYNESEANRRKEARSESSVER